MTIEQGWHFKHLDNSYFLKRPKTVLSPHFEAGRFLAKTKSLSHLIAARGGWQKSLLSNTEMFRNQSERIDNSLNNGGGWVEEVDSATEVIP